MFEKLKPYLFPVGATVAVGALSSVLTMGNRELYHQIAQPFFAPPAWVFPVVWSALYVAMGVSLTWIRQSKRPHDTATTLYWVQLAVNFLWNPFFFNLRRFALAFWWLLLLIVLVWWMIAAFARISKKAALLQLPYGLWVLFAGVLNYAIMRLNP